MCPFFIHERGVILLVYNLETELAQPTIEKWLKLIRQVTYNPASPGDYLKRTARPPTPNSPRVLVVGYPKRHSFVSLIASWHVCALSCVSCHLIKRAMQDIPRREEVHQGPPGGRPRAHPDALQALPQHHRLSHGVQHHAQGAPSASGGPRGRRYVPYLLSLNVQCPGAYSVVASCARAVVAYGHSVSDWFKHMPVGVLALHDKLRQIRKFGYPPEGEGDDAARNKNDTIVRKKNKPVPVISFSDLEKVCTVCRVPCAVCAVRLVWRVRCLYSWWWWLGCTVGPGVWNEPPSAPVVSSLLDRRGHHLLHQRPAPARVVPPRGVDVAQQLGVPRPQLAGAPLPPPVPKRPRVHAQGFWPQPTHTHTPTHRPLTRRCWRG